MEFQMSGTKKAFSSSLVTADMLGSLAVILSGAAGMLYVLFVTFGGHAA
jgi:hypothetical protein